MGCALCFTLRLFIAFAFALQVVPPLMGQITTDFNVSRAQAGLLMSMVVIPGIFLGIPAGVFADRYGARSVGFMATTLIALGCFITAIANSFGTALIGRLILGIGGAFIIAATPTKVTTAI